MEANKYEYKSEVLKMMLHWGVREGESNSDLDNLNDLINKRAQEGWELITHTYMPIQSSTQKVILITFRRLK